MKNIVELGNENIFDGKAGNLNQLYNDFNVARGFIITNEYFLEFLDVNNISLENDNKVIKTKIINGIFPNESKLINYFKKHKYNKVIVRSSTILEDSDNYSFAGQFDSFINTNVDNLILNIKKCWASGFSDNIIDYLKYNKISYNYHFDILIQEMIISDISGIAFSINPTNSKREILVNISFNQCNDLVSGKTIPLIYHIDTNICGDKNISRKKLLIIKDNIERLKRIYNKDIEIEFCFKKDKFYLFQVRPITKIYFSLNNYINSEFWCSFKNNNWSLFTRSLWIMGASKYKNKRINNEITEDITIYYPYNRKQVRAFNGNQKPLDDVTISNHSISDINKYIYEYEIVVNNIKKLSLTIKNNINSNNFELFKNNLKKLIKYNAIINSYEYLIGSLGQAFHDNLDNHTLENINKWRNSENNSYFPIYDDIFIYIKNYFNINIDDDKLKMYTHVNELLKLCNKKLKVETLLNRINNRQVNGFVLLNLRNKKYNNKVITDKKTIDIVKKRFSKLQKDILNNNKDCVKGYATFKSDKIITGRAIVIKNNDDLSKYDLNNKILVCEITTAKDIKYLKNIKALIVNNGGVLCHSAIISRELNIPCLIGCQIATHYFNTGDRVLVDLNNEVIRKIKKH